MTVVHRIDLPIIRQETGRSCCTAVRCLQLRRLSRLAPINFGMSRSGPFGSHSLDRGDGPRMSAV